MKWSEKPKPIIEAYCVKRTEGRWFTAEVLLHDGSVWRLRPEFEFLGPAEDKDAVELFTRTPDHFTLVS